MSWLFAYYDLFAKPMKKFPEAELLGMILTFLFFFLIPMVVSEVIREVLLLSGLPFDKAFHFTPHLLILNVVYFAVCFAASLLMKNRKNDG